MRKKEYKAVAYEFSDGTSEDGFGTYSVGYGITFSNSSKEAIRRAKASARTTLLHAEDGVTFEPTLAYIHVWKRGKEIINKTY